MRRGAILLLAWLVAPVAPALAHEMRPSYLELRETTRDTYEVLWKVPARGLNERLSLYVRFSEYNIFFSAFNSHIILLKTAFNL